MGTLLSHSFGLEEQAFLDDDDDDDDDDDQCPLTVLVAVISGAQSRDIRIKRNTQKYTMLSFLNY